MGTWWVPVDDDLNDDGDFDTLPQRREPGVLLPKADDGWALLLARQLPAEGVSARESVSSGRRECDLMWGDVLGSAIRGCADSSLPGGTVAARVDESAAMTRAFPNGKRVEFTRGGGRF